jgi:Flp pilus assembly protein TadG
MRLPVARVESKARLRRRAASKPLPPRRASSSARRRGQALVEFALILPVMMLILLIAVDFGRLFSAYISNVNAAREGASYAATHAGDSTYILADFNSGVADAATGQSNAQGLSGGGALDVSYKCFSPPPAPPTAIDCHVASTNYAGGIGNQVTVTVKQPFDFVTPFIGSLFGGSLTLTTSATGPVLNPIVASVVTPPLTITANNQTRVFGAADPAFTYGVSPSVSLTTPATCTSTATVSSPIGSYPITCSGAVLAGYSIGYVAGTLTVTSASLTITANNQTRVVGAADPAFTYGVSPSVSLTTPATCTSTATVSSPIGSYPITCSGAVLAGYSIGYVAGTLTVTATPTATPTPTCGPVTVTISYKPKPNVQDVTITVTFSATVTNGPGTKWAWTFGTGQPSNLESPTYTFTYTLGTDKNGHPNGGPQTWPVSLTVTTTPGCTGTGTTMVTLG